jgi:hypothetical protein
MPLISALLPRRDRRKLPGFTEISKASVTDATPRVLGPLEGFTNMGWSVFAGLGYEPCKDYTWRVSRYLWSICCIRLITNHRHDIRHVKSLTVYPNK